MQVRHDDLAQRNLFLGRRNTSRLDDKPQHLADVVHTLPIIGVGNGERIEPQGIAAVITEDENLLGIIQPGSLVIRAAAVDDDVHVFRPRIVVIVSDDLLQIDRLAASGASYHRNIAGINVLPVRVVEIVAQRQVIDGITEKNAFGIRPVTSRMLEQRQRLPDVYQVERIPVHAGHRCRV